MCSFTYFPYKVDFMIFLPPLIRDFGKQNSRGNVYNFRQSCVLIIDRSDRKSQPASMTKRRSEGHTSGCDKWISIRSVDNTQLLTEILETFPFCFPKSRINENGGSAIEYLVAEKITFLHKMERKTILCCIARRKTNRTVRAAYCCV